MKNNRKWILQLITALGLGAILTIAIYFLYDSVWNGRFVDWFTNNYTYTSYYENFGEEIAVNQIAWYRLKNLLGVSLFVIIESVIAITVIVSNYCVRRKEKQLVTEISEKMHCYMEKEVDISDVFPKEYSEISMQMLEIKTTNEKREQIIKEETRRKNDLITYLAHDLKTPLTSVIGYLSLLDEASDMPLPQKEKYTRIALNKANRLEKLINEFFEITRYNLQQISIEKEPIDLYYMLVQMTDEFYPILTAHGNTVTFQADENLTIYGDPEKLARVFNNILKNAIAYSYIETSILISAKKEENKVVISFENKGKTIPKHKLDSIFEKFFRLDEARTTNAGGAGLGLAIAKEIVELHGGTICAESEQDTTTFCIELPN